MAFCKYCGKELREGMRFCGGCGNAVEVVVPQKQIIYEEEKPMESILDNKTVVALTLGVLAFSLVAIIVVSFLTKDVPATSNLLGNLPSYYI